jgi:hypothetical protein
MNVHAKALLVVGPKPAGLFLVLDPDPGAKAYMLRYTLAFSEQGWTSKNAWE